MSLWPRLYPAVLATVFMSTATAQQSSPPPFAFVFQATAEYFGQGEFNYGGASFTSGCEEPSNSYSDASFSASKVAGPNTVTASITTIVRGPTNGIIADSNWGGSLYVYALGTPGTGFHLQMTWTGQASASISVGGQDGWGADATDFSKTATAQIGQGLTGSQSASANDDATLDGTTQSTSIACFGSTYTLATGYRFGSDSASGFDPTQEQGEAQANSVLTVSGYLVPSSLTILNPFASFASQQLAPPTLDMPTVLSSPPATSLAADGESAVVLVYQSTSSEPVTFDLISEWAGVGALGEFDPSYLATPSPVGGGGQNNEITVTNPTYGPDANGNYWFLALLWAPSAMPGVSLVNLTVAASQQGGQGPTAQASIAIQPPPLLLVHGVWSSAKEAGFVPGQQGFYDWILRLYPHNQIFWVDYQAENSKTFSDPNTQETLLLTMGDALYSAAASGMAARTVDVYAHSMGGLVARYFLSSAGYLGNAALLPNPVHKLITLGTPHGNAR